MMGHEGNGLLSYELRRLVGQPSLVITQLVACATAVVVRLKNRPELDDRTVFELLMYAMIILEIGLQDLVQGLHEDSFVAIIKERGICGRLTFLRFAVQATACLVLCGVGLSTSTFLSALGPVTWAGCWLAVIGTIAFVVAGGRLIDLYMSRLSEQKSSMVDVVGVSMCVGGYAVFLALGILLFAYSGASHRSGAWLMAAYACAVGICAVSALWFVARGQPRRRAVALLSEGSLRPAFPQPSGKIPTCLSPGCGLAPLPGHAFREFHADQHGGNHRTGLPPHSARRGQCGINRRTDLAEGVPNTAVLPCVNSRGSRHATTECGQPQPSRPRHLFTVCPHRAIPAPSLFADPPRSHTQVSFILIPEVAR